MKALFVISLCLSLTGCAQKQKPESITKPQYPKTHDGSIKITNDQVKSAIEALQNGDKSWYTYFTDNPEMTDDGQQVDFKSFC